MRYNPLPEDHVYTGLEDHEELFFTFPDGGAVNALFFPAKEQKGVLLYIHGRGGNLQKPWGKISKDFLQRGYSVLIYDHRGFGKSKGPSNQETFLHDACYAYDYLKERFPDETPLVYGVSFGSGIATYVASERSPKALILEAPYFSMLDLIPRMGYPLPQWALKLILKYPLETNRWIANVSSPIYIFHGKKDELIPYHSSERLMQNIQKSTVASLITLKNGKHNYLSKHPLYQTSLDSILKGAQTYEPIIRGKDALTEKSAEKLP